MARINLTGGAYTARSVTAAAQRSLNLYPEELPATLGEPTPMAHYPTPGLRRLATPSPDLGRGLYVASNGTLFAAVGSLLYRVTSDWAFILVGNLAVNTSPVSMADNGLTLVAVDGSAAGWTVDLTSYALGTISDPAFYGADRVDYLDTFFLFNRPGTSQWYTSQSEAVTFDSLYIVGKESSADPMQGVAVLGSEVWTIGAKTSEVWFNSGAADFPFQRVPSAVLPFGCAAKASIASTGSALLWIGADDRGQGVLYQGAYYQVQRVSTHAVEEVWRQYPRIDDAIGGTHQQDGHTFYTVTFPTADRTWAFNPALAERGWHERAWHDVNGVQHRHRASAVANAYGTLVAQDWQTGALYALDLDTYTDDGAPIHRLRSFPHLLSNGYQVSYTRFVADMQVGTASGTSVVGAAPVEPPELTLRWSDTRGASWGEPVTEDLGAAGDYDRSIQFRRLGLARDRVFELSWSAPVKTALLGAFVDAQPCGA